MAASQSIEGLSNGVKTIIAMAFISVGLVLFALAMPMFNKGIKSASTVTQKVSTANYAQYVNNDSVQGSDVISAINTLAADDFYVKVKTNSDPSGKVYTTNVYNLTDKNDDDFIEPTAKYSSDVNSNDNDASVGLTFVQQ